MNVFTVIYKSHSCVCVCMCVPDDKVVFLLKGFYKESSHNNWKPKTTKNTFTKSQGLYEENYEMLL